VYITDTHNKERWQL